MKTLDFWRFAAIFAFGIGAFVTTSCDDDDDDLKTSQVPEAVLTTFNQDYSSATRVTWETEGTYYVADFYQDGNEHDAWYSPTGTWVMTEVDHGVNLSGLPEAVQNGYAATIYAQEGWIIDDIDEIQRPGYETIYKIEVEKNGQPDHDLYFDLNGTLYRDVQDQDDDRNEGLIQQSSLPTAISTYINTNYPNAQVVDFEREGSYYEVDIRYNGESKELLFSSDYTWVQTTTDYSRSIPAIVQNAITANYPGKTIDDCDYVETAAGETYYLVDLDNYDNDVKVSTDGTILGEVRD